ncbi:uncharacterized protein LOC114274846 [Camellia sinensis]|uniref:uncharacterized protein LOC114274846 n=1 Tax=Camellia sinensis TaxID=4442 RepID=UPI0010355132|nr:uncharacterized protein LOC114274846 [Camellia sinensis]
MKDDDNNSNETGVPLEKKQRVKKLVECQKVAIDKFFTSDKQAEQSVEDLNNEEFETLVNIENENLVDEEGNGKFESAEINQDDEMNTECEHSNIDNPGTWKIVDQNLRDFLVEKGPVRRNCEFNFPKDDSSRHRHFSHIHYIRHLPNGEKFDRTLLIYSELLDRVFCFCCKLFKQEGNKTQLPTKGFKDWRNIDERLKGHESGNEHITCMSKWIELEERLGKHQTIDKSIQEQVNKEREHLRRVLLVIIAVVKTLANNNLPFRGSHVKIYEESNGLLLSITEMIGEFDSTIEQHLRGIENDYLKEGLMVKSLSQTRWESRIESVKPLRYHASKIRDALVGLYNNPTTDSIAKSEAKSLVTHELETFEFLFSIVIWYNLLFHVNSVSKLLQSENMDITVAVKKLYGLVKYVAMYREVGFTEAMVEAKEMASELGIEPTFVEKHIISRKKQFDKNVSEEVT